MKKVQWLNFEVGQLWRRFTNQVAIVFFLLRVQEIQYCYSLNDSFIVISCLCIKWCSGFFFFFTQTSQSLVFFVSRSSSVPLSKFSTVVLLMVHSLSFHACLFISPSVKEVNLTVHHSLDGELLNSLKHREMFWN